MRLPVNLDIATTHITKGIKQTLVASLGVALGVAIYLFMNSLDAGFTKFSLDSIFQSSAHLKIYKDDIISRSIDLPNHKGNNIIINPQITASSKRLINPDELLASVKNEPYITNAVAQIDYSVFYNRGSTEIKGSGIGVNMDEYNSMFQTEDNIVAGNIRDLQSNLNGVIIGSGIANKLNLNLNDNVTMSSSLGVIKTLRIVGIIEFGNKAIDDTRSYVNLSTAQQFIKEGPSYVNTVYANTTDAEQTDLFKGLLAQVTHYSIEDWKTSNVDIVSTNKTRDTMMGSMSMSVLLLTGFIIFNILSSTISQKIDDIAILKATGFSSKDVIIIFILEALIMGVIGTIIGLGIGSILIQILSKVYMGGPVGYFPITFELPLYLKSFFLGVVMTFLAGYFPARSASHVDPVDIFRK